MVLNRSPGQFGSDFALNQLFHPEPVWINFSAVSKQIIPPEEHLVQPGGVGNSPANPVVPESGRFVERAGADAVGAVAAVVGPELQTGFSVDMPYVDAFTIGYVVRLRRRRAEHDAFTRTFFSAFFAQTHIYRQVGFRRKSYSVPGR